MSPVGQVWTTEIPDGVGLPRGRSDAARAAVEALRPKDQEATEFLFGRVNELARTFNEHEYLEQDAPRRKQVIEEMEALASIAAELANRLTKTSDLTRFYLQTGGSGLDDLLTADLESVDFRSLPRHSSPNDDGLWVKELTRLSNYFRFCLENFRHRKGIGESEKPDPGGDRTLFKELYGAPRWLLIHSAFALWELFRPGVASSNEEGEFHGFLINVFEYATGRDPDESKLVYWLKQTVPPLRRYQDLSRREPDMMDELEVLHDSPQTPEVERRISELVNDLQTLARARFDLFRKVYPHSYR